MRQEHQVGSLNNCISELQQQAHAQRLELQDAQHGKIDSRREQVRLQEEWSLKEQVLRDTQTRSMHEMGEMKRAQEGRVHEVSVQKIKRRSWDNTNRSLLSCRKCKNRLILWMIQVNFKKWNQITVGDCLMFQVSMQWFQVLVPCWAATNTCLLTDGIHQDYRKTFLVINFLRLLHPKIILKELTLAHHKENED